MRRIILIGNPNVGKSVIFSRLTGLGVISSNYPGTTVEYTKGYTIISGEKMEVIDAPGTYSLDYTSDAEKIAVEMLKESFSGEKRENIAINVLDSTNFERNLNLTLQLLKQKIPVIVVLNFWDETSHLGISINTEELEKILKVPVVTTCAVTGEGITRLVKRISEVHAVEFDFTEDEKWNEIGKIVGKVQKLSHHHHTFLERLGEITIRPLTGIPFSLALLYITFNIVRFLGEGITNAVMDPVFKNYYYPFIIKIGEAVFPVKFLHDIFIGGKLMESFGVLTTGVYIPFVVVFPYIFSFYLALSILEDIGYLPRLAVLFDNLLHKVGVHGYTGISIILGFGCKVPAMCATRILETKREKIIAISLILMIAPCMPQTAMIISLVSPFGNKYLILIFSVLFAVSIITALSLNKILKGEIPELFIEIPPYRIPRISMLKMKLWIRLKDFFKEAVPLIMAGIGMISLLDMLGVMKFLMSVFGIFFQYLLGLPEKTISVVVLGFLRKDVAIALLSPFSLSAKQLCIASVFMVLYLPCIATFFMLIKEMGFKDTVKIILIMLLSAVITGTVMNLIM